MLNLDKKSVLIEDGFLLFIYWLYVNSWGNPKNEIEIFNKWQKIKLSLVFAIDRQTYAKYDCGSA